MTRCSEPEGVYPWALQETGPSPRPGPPPRPFAGPSRGPSGRPRRPRCPSISRYRSGRILRALPALVRWARAGAALWCSPRSGSFGAVDIGAAVCDRWVGAPWGAAGAGKSRGGDGPGVAETALETLLGLLQLKPGNPCPCSPRPPAPGPRRSVGQGGDEKFAALESQWRPERSRGRPPEGLTLAARHAFPQGLYPFRDRFCALAEHVFLPLLEAESEVSLGAARETLEAWGALP